jgi:hypothetical protein
LYGGTGTALTNIPARPGKEGDFLTEKELELLNKALTDKTPKQIKALEARKARKAGSHIADMAQEDFGGRWEDFTGYLKARQPLYEAAMKADDTERGEPLKRIISHPKDPEYKEYQELADVVGRLNRGISYNPTFVSGPSARHWIETQAENPKLTADARNAYRNKWAVKMADLDDNKDTPDNVIVFSDKNVGRIRAIDGYSLTPLSRKEAQREFYGALPDPKERAKLRKEEIKKMKAYLRKNWSAEKQAKESYEQFELNDVQSAYANVRATAKDFLDVWKVRVGKKEDAPKTVGCLTPKHYLQLLQAMTKKIYETVCISVLGLPKTYFLNDEDPAGVKKAPVKKFLKQYTHIAPGEKYSRRVAAIIRDELNEGDFKRVFQDFATAVNRTDKTTDPELGTITDAILVVGFQNNPEGRGRIFNIVDHQFGLAKPAKEYAKEGTVRQMWNTYKLGRDGTILLDVSSSLPSSSSSSSLASLSGPPPPSQLKAKEKVRRKGG